MTEEGNSLSAIRAKEQEINNRLEEARAQASTIIDAAHSTCRDMADEAGLKAKSDADASYLQAVEAARTEAQGIRARIPAEVDSINSTAQSRLQTVASAIVSQVVPGSPS